MALWQSRPHGGMTSRLESACKQYATRIIISENTYTKLRGTYRTREVDRVVVQGKTEPVSIHEVLDYHTDETFPNMREVLGLFGDGLTHYRSGNWQQAVDAFKKALNANPEDNVCDVYIDRCRELEKSPPKDWDGVWVMDSK